MFVPMSKKLGSSYCTSVIKSWLNSWATTERLQLENRRSCIFCCGGEDALHHYLRCEPLWSCVIHILGLPNECIDRSPAQRLGIVDTSLLSLLQIVIASRVYHAMKGRLEEGCYSNDIIVEISWAADLMRHLFMEIPQKLRREIG